MSNVAGKAYAMNVLTPMRPRLTWINRLIFMFGRAFPDTLGGLLGLSLIHFARWAIVKRNQWPDPDPDSRLDKQTGRRDEHRLENDYMLFCSNFNGTWDQYIDAFSDGIPDGLDLFWYSSTKYPKSIPITPFKTYISHNQIDTDYYYNATPGAAQRDIKCALKVYKALRKLESEHGSLSADRFAEAYVAALGEIQGCFGDPGFAPVASRDTEKADNNRKQYVTGIWQDGREGGT